MHILTQIYDKPKIFYLAVFFQFMAKLKLIGEKLFLKVNPATFNVLHDPCGESSPKYPLVISFIFAL